MLLCIGLLAACSSGPEPINYGKEACAHCKMTIMDKRFANELVTARGKVYKFDAIECLTAFLKENPALATDAGSSFLIQDYEHPGAFQDARKAWFLHEADLASPMGGNLAAFSKRGSAENAKHDPKANIMDWPTLLKQDR
ncbi:nitrous oxide reductase accessory protein NosL [Mucilaginibacter boryungensis]|uniref:Nitrous oxide reductase accessory protein NosL n=1 Tax=Mucilaginibacter boryungensis TaxID=768480 RepID=A0ABR9XD70_9SPHI|nr:nitrous oxide reductase accessory protein NosL [Mucilaginibacter boryungensis]MBE9665343.1 nitrous oxide reductase accessory protein NosL [Mucilaginibacter boryungensis]